MIERRNGEPGRYVIADDGGRGMDWFNGRMYDFETQMRATNGQIRFNDIFRSGGEVWMRSSMDRHPSTHAQPMQIDPSTGRPRMVMIHYDGREGLPDIARANQNPVPWASAENMPSHRISFHEIGHAADMLTGDQPVDSAGQRSRVYTLPHLMTLPRSEIENIGLASASALPGSENAYAAEFDLARRTFYADEEEMDENGNITPFVDDDPTAKRSVQNGPFGPVPDIAKGGGTADDYKKQLESFTNKYAGIYRQSGGQEPTLANDDLATLFKEMIRHKLFNPEEAQSAELPSGGDPLQFMNNTLRYAKDSVLKDIGRGFDAIADRGKDAGQHFFEYNKSGKGADRIQELTKVALDDFIRFFQVDDTPGPTPQPDKPTAPFEPPIPAGISGEDYARHLNDIAKKIRSGMSSGLFISFDPKKGFDNDEVKNKFIEMAQYRANLPDSQPIKYDDELNAGVVAFANSIKRTGRGFNLKGGGLQQKDVERHMTNMVLQKIADTKNANPFSKAEIDIGKIRKAVEHDFYLRLEHHLKSVPNNKGMLDVYGTYIKSDRGQSDLNSLTERAKQTFEKDPNRYLRPNPRNADGFPWKSVLEDIKQQLRVQEDNYHPRIDPFIHYLERRGNSVAERWWQEKATERKLSK